ncbi:putative rapamycin-insensitive companion of mTOR [Triplophysa rosa]|uniref:Rapamycin-insensitive companion of mTOR n=1 Tax=Triplophysa rosa TaxID=992332 RepID=A0A9W8CBU1_TRIRA|nr:putative rapamycin-insensitive companion of mTOR [Triplophysa rosa]
MSDGFSQWHSQPSHNHLEVVAQSKYSGVSGCSDAAVSQGSASSTPSTELILDLSDGFSQWHSQPSHNHLEVVAQSKYSGVSGCSDAAVSQGSASSTPSTELILGGKAISEDGPACRVLLRKEVLRLVIHLSSSVGTKGHETGLLT